MDTERFHALRKSPIAKSILENLLARQGNPRLTKVDELVVALHRSGAEVSRNNVIATFRELEGIGYGKFLVGRKGHPTRFEWGIPFAKVRRTAAAADAIDKAENGSKRMADTLPTTLTHKYNLREDFVVSFELPVNLIDVEASRLADFIRTIPFG